MQLECNLISPNLGCMVSARDNGAPIERNKVLLSKESNWTEMDRDVVDENGGPNIFLHKELSSSSKKPKDLSNQRGWKQLACEARTSSNIKGEEVW